MNNREIPLWVVASLGKRVALVKDFVGPCETYEAGCEGVLTTIQADDGGSFHVTVALDPNDPTYWENFTFDQVRPPHAQITFQLDIERGAIVF